MKRNVKEFSELPLTLTVDEVGQILGIGRVKAYELANQEDFPKLRVGKRIVIPKQLFINWMHNCGGATK